MSRIDALNQRYAASASLVRNGVEIVCVGDPSGARFNVAVRRLMALARNEGGAYLDHLVSASKALRWRQITHPQPIALNHSLRDLASEVIKHAGRLRGAISDQALLDELTSSASVLAETDSEIGSALLRSIDEAGANTCVVVAASRPAAAGLQLWLRDQGFLVVTPGQLERDQPELEQAYVIGPPKFYSSSLVTAPVTEAVTFLMPAWFGDRSLPRSAIAPYAEGAIRLAARVFMEGAASEPVIGLPEDSEGEDEFLPQPTWGSRRDGDREPTSEEVEARRLLLSGNLAMWLDDGDRIRSLDPDQPVGVIVKSCGLGVVRRPRTLGCRAKVPG
ncbi:hypothetical protein IU418_24255 [Nocardia farcinica]|uniref:hypothetical protein n=1 Tax=Nocardia farcinica TaxID=37329 RepID=UPI001B3C756C|nr:hypothetical protein [Nocardia farcinica]MBF6540322.1 hypothetical protein [Nocardia farcinica]